MYLSSALASNRTGLNCLWLVTTNFRGDVLTLQVRIQVFDGVGLNLTIERLEVPAGTPTRLRWFRLAGSTSLFR